MLAGAWVFIVTNVHLLMRAQGMRGFFSGSTVTIDAIFRVLRKATSAASLPPQRAVSEAKYIARVWHTPRRQSLLLAANSVNPAGCRGYRPHRFARRRRESVLVFPGCSGRRIEKARAHVPVVRKRK